GGRRSGLAAQSRPQSAAVPFWGAVMRVAVLSDLHLPKTPAAVIEGVIAEIAGFAPTAVVLGGDLGEAANDFQPCLHLFSRRTCPLLVVAGNHDVFPDRVGSHSLWEEILPDTVRRLGFHWLEGEPFVHDGVAVAGTIAWYDYSAADPVLQATPQDFAR